MPEYKAYLTAKDTKSRKTRKGSRKKTFEYNKYQAKKETRKRLAKEKEEKAKAKEEKKD